MTDLFMITGSRHWTDKFLILDALLRHCDGGETMLNGNCPLGGADKISYDIWHGMFKFPVRLFTPDTARFGKQAFAIRNQDMVNCSPKFCLAFPMRGEPNKGTLMTMKFARTANIPVIEVWNK